MIYTQIQYAYSYDQFQKHPCVKIEMVKIVLFLISQASASATECLPSYYYCSIYSMFLVQSPILESHHSCLNVRVPIIFKSYQVCYSEIREILHHFIAIHGA